MSACLQLPSWTRDKKYKVEPAHIFNKVRLFSADTAKIQMTAGKLRSIFYDVGPLNLKSILCKSWLIPASRPHEGHCNADGVGAAEFIHSRLSSMI